MRNPDLGGHGRDDGAVEFGGMGFGFTTAYCVDCGFIDFTVHLFGEVAHEVGMHLTVAQAIDLQDLLRRAVNDAIETTTDSNEMEF
ncbi:hypothetical protein [Nocardia yunnanensis]|nr:hypothetical protein [Nocardia yunnanensis]